MLVRVAVVGVVLASGAVSREIDEDDDASFLEQNEEVDEDEDAEEDETFEDEQEEDELEDEEEDASAFLEEEAEDEDEKNDEKDSETCEGSRSSHWQSFSSSWSAWSGGGLQSDDLQCRPLPRESCQDLCHFCCEWPTMEMGFRVPRKSTRLRKDPRVV